ncbi:glutathione-s-transferase theta, gst [Plectosphaerella plurivora]|uniref:Glutathione-s-transferase theta, gst n=1 Tax=Plectosphaerella plurivora TaxID=936078 RepID=A0A9P9AFP8_9PEZI|nr:glutathione-s-transferase theta, gst [Plectosphaerella plurivora]
MSSSLQPFVLYYHGPSPNPTKVLIILEELGLPYKLEEIVTDKLKTEPFISLNPNGRVPALVDPNRDNLTLFESMAIIDYLIAEYDTDAKLHYTTFEEKYAARCWGYFQVSGQGPYFGQSAWFHYYHPEKLQSAIDRYENEARRVTTVIEAHLAKQGTDYLVGDKLTYADLAWVPYYNVFQRIAPGAEISDLKLVQAWLARMNERPSVAKSVEFTKAEIEKHHPKATDEGAESTNTKE